MRPPEQTSGRNRRGVDGRSDVCAETQRLRDEADRVDNWKRWGPYLSERQWGTVREDYSSDGSCWDYFPHDAAPYRAYRWGEDGLLGICDRKCRLCFALALWNGRDRILKERLFGLTNGQGNHGEDVKEKYYYLDATPTGSYLKGLYKYPQAAFPYERLLRENKARDKTQREYEIEDTGVFDDNRYFDVTAEYAKADPEDVLIRVTIVNRGPEAATCHLLPTLWFRNGWSWGATHEGTFPKPTMRLDGDTIRTEQRSLGEYALRWRRRPDDVLFTENETNAYKLFGPPFEAGGYTKDAFHRFVLHDEKSAVNPQGTGTKATLVYRLKLAAGESQTFDLRLSNKESGFDDFDKTFSTRIQEADAFYDEIAPPCLEPEEGKIWRQAYAGTLWTRQFYHYVVDQWLKGDPDQPPPPEKRRKNARNRAWKHLFNYDIVSMPDKWEYPWYAVWDSAFHMLPMSRVDPHFAKEQLKLFMREWYMRPDGAVPAYEFNFGDVNPPVHAWAVWRVYKMTGPRGNRDRAFLAACFHKLLLNFTWWVNRKDEAGKHLFGGGFLGLDNIGIFDRSGSIPDGRRLEQADGTAWMAFYCVTMLSIALELASEDPSYEDIASKFFEHFAAITHAMNGLGGSGLWDEVDGFYYDQLYNPDDHTTSPLRVRSMVGIIPLFACGILDAEVIDRLDGFRRRMDWFLKHQKDLARSLDCKTDADGRTQYLLSVPGRDRLCRVLRYVFSEREFLSPWGVRSLSRAYADEPYTLDTSDGQTLKIFYAPAESPTRLFGGNSNWRGPVWFPLNFLLVEALQRYHHFYGQDVKAHTSDGRVLNLSDAADDVQQRLVRIFLPDEAGLRPCLGDDVRHSRDSHWKDLVPFYEYFHAETGRGCGASHQTGWTALVAQCIESLCRHRARDGEDGMVHGVRLGTIG